jgi:predicted DNA-binding transcriptional regulator YafY
MQINRLLEIAYILLQRKVVTAKELSERFGVSQRTIYRDIDTLSLSGIPVYTKIGKGGGISLLPDFVLSKSILSEQEQNDILSSLSGLIGMGSIESDHVLQKLTAIFNKPVHKWLEVDISGWGGTGKYMFAGFKMAILDKWLVEFDYYGANNIKTFRRVEPIQLWFKSKAWYVKCFCLTRQAMRLFKLSRIRNLFITNEPFSARQTLPSVFESSTEGCMNDVYIKLKIHADMAYRVYDDYIDYHAEKDEDGSMTVTLRWPEDDWVYGYILSFGEYIEVLEPAYLRDIIRTKALKMVEKHTL